MSRIEYHTIPARMIQVGDRMSADAAKALDHWYDCTQEYGADRQDHTVTAVEHTEGDEGEALTLVSLDGSDMPIEVRGDIRITVVRDRPTVATTAAEAPKLVATFSYAAGSGALLSVAPAGDDYNALAESRPGAGDDPRDALTALGYRLAYPEQSYTLTHTMRSTSYAKLYVLPIQP